jgi:hypothetical protein
MKKIIVFNLLMGASNFAFSQTSSERFFESCQSQKSNAEICQCMTEKKEKLKVSLTKEFDSLIKTAKEISLSQKDNAVLNDILKKQIEILSVLKNTMLQNALLLGELKASASLDGSGYSCFLAEEQYQELNKIKIFLDERNEELNSYK